MSKLLIHEPPLQVLPSLAVKVGLNEAIFLQQLHYWLEIARQPKSRTGKFTDDSWWVFNSVAEWREGNFPFWSISTINRLIKSLEKKGFIKSRKDLNKVGFDKTKWYTIDYVKLESTNRISQNEQTNKSEWINDDSNLTKPIPETPTETPTENKDGFENSLTDATRPPTRDPLTDIFKAATSDDPPTETTGPNPDDQWIEYGSKIWRLYKQQTAIKTLNPAQKGALSLIADAPNFNWEKFQSYLDAFAESGGYAYDVTAFINGYPIWLKTGDINAAKGRGQNGGQRKPERQVKYRITKKPGVK